MKNIFFVVFFVLAPVSFIDAAHTSKIELTDGSILEGEIVSFSEGQYTIKSPSLGILKIGESKIRNRRILDPIATLPKGAAASVDAAAIQDGAQKVQAVITGDPDIMKSLPELLANPDFQDILKDSEVLNAVEAMDVKTLMANEKFVKAVHDPKIREISRKVKEKNVLKDDEVKA